jgi:hypothetical protein
MMRHYQFTLISKGFGRSVPGLSLMTFFDVLLHKPTSQASRDTPKSAHVQHEMADSM